MSSGVQSKNPRVRRILISKNGLGICCICGKNTSKHPGHDPAPIGFILRFVATLWQKYPDDNEHTMGGSLCMACAKRLSSRLDAVIEQIESEYR